MNKTCLIIAQLLLGVSLAFAVSDEEALSVLKRAVPPAPGGWTASVRDRTDSAAGLRKIRYAVTYTRVAGLREDQKRLDAAYAESSQRNREAVKPQIDELIRKQTEASLALRKAVRRRNAAEEKRLNEELEENGARMHALHEETDRKVAGDVAPFLVRDAEAGISIGLNEETAQLPGGGTVNVKGAAFALYRPGAASGATGWKEGELLVLYGEWRALGNSVFRVLAPDGADRRIWSVRIVITGEQARAEQLLRQMDLKALLSLME